MVVVHAMGERYLWIDSLCIIQDDGESKHRDIQRMDIVYSKAFATIVAMHGADANAGLPGLHLATRPPQQIESIWVSGKSPDLAYREDASSDTQKITMASTPSPLDFVLETSVWDSRGWILQERLLSRRCLYFSANYVYFQCNQETVCETTLSGPAEDFGGVPKPLSLAKDNPLTNLKEIANVSKDERMRRTFKVYKELVEMFTVRNLTVPSDILNAFSRLLSVLGEYFESSMVSGLPAAGLDLGLLWTPAQQLIRRKSPKSSASGNGQSRVSEALFPTWSWAGWVGPVEYRLTHPEGEPLPSPQIDAFYTHHHGRLKRINTRQASARLKSDIIANATGSMYPPGLLLTPPSNLNNSISQALTLDPTSYSSGLMQLTPVSSGSLRIRPTTTLAKMITSIPKRSRPLSAYKTSAVATAGSGLISRMTFVTGLGSISSSRCQSLRAKRRGRWS
jgi:hypothetical protein